MANYKSRKYINVLLSIYDSFPTVLVGSGCLITEGMMPWYSQLHKHLCHTQRAMTLPAWTKCSGQKSHSFWGSQGALHRDHEGGLRLRGFSVGQVLPWRQNPHMWEPTDEDGGWHAKGLWFWAISHCPPLPPSYQFVILSLTVSPLPLSLYPQYHLRPKAFVSSLWNRITWMPLPLFSSSTESFSLLLTASQKLDLTMSLLCLKTWRPPHSSRLALFLLL